MTITVFHKSKHNLVFYRGNSSLAWFWKRAVEKLQEIMKDKECLFFIVPMVAKSVLFNDSYILICYASWQVGASSRLCQFRCCNTLPIFYPYNLGKPIFNYIIVTDTDMEGNIRIDRMPKAGGEGNIISTGPYHDPRAVCLSWYCTQYQQLLCLLHRRPQSDTYNVNAYCISE